MGETLLSVLALGGLACIVLFVAAMLFNVSVIMFKTGSMSPTIPAGSAALVREIPASEVEVGDVVTVERPGQLPVTHRVTSVADADVANARTITMRGDANVQDDPNPYVIETVDIVMFSVPGLANVIVWFSNPLVLGGITVAASVLVTWAFWPRARSEAEGDEGAEDAEVTEGTEEPDAAPTGRRRGRHVAAMVALAGGAGLLVAVAAPPPAIAAGESTTVIEGDVIRLTSIGDFAAMQSMRPGVPAYWQVGVEADTQDPGTIDVTAEASGSAELGLDLEFRACTVQWIDGVCSGEEVGVNAPAASLLGADPHPLLTLPADQARWVLVTATIPEDASGSVSVLIRATGMGDDLVAAPENPLTTLPATGGTPAWMLGLGAVLVTIGLALAARARRRRVDIHSPQRPEDPKLRLTRVAAVITAVGLGAGLLVPTPRDTVAAWTDAEIATGTLQAGTVPRVTQIQCEQREHWVLLLRYYDAYLYWPEPTPLLPGMSVSYRVNFTKGSTTTSETTSSTNYLMSGSVLGDLLSLLLSSPGPITVRVETVQTDVTSNTSWVSATSETSVTVAFTGSLAGAHFRCP
ncbi:S26 family signal peptidase [Gulosibacter faecalis]|uniref:S26 family signal peptidase n=1 Tax=Gulosibacter faecalis TaxID=272240 RepID=A0ABW5UWI8_9MICO|nr:S26 family signal peptidase [Gulosibacter faecalis]